MSRKIWQPENPTPGWIQAEKDSDLTIYLPHPDGDVPMFFRLIKAGEFRMGSRLNITDESPFIRVVISEPCYFGTFPVTQAQYRAIATACLDDLKAIEENEGVDPSYFKGKHLPPERRGFLPVEQVSWDEANAIGHWLSASGLLPRGCPAGLPSEAIWEYACRAGSETNYSSGEDETALAKAGWYQGNSGNVTQPVGELIANRWGLYDLHGNVNEWCEDVWDVKSYHKRTDGWEATAWGGQDIIEYLEESKVFITRILRGGSCGGRGNFSHYLGGPCRSANRSSEWPNYRSRLIGFRLCLFPNLANKRIHMGKSLEDQLKGRINTANCDETTGKTPPPIGRPRGAWRNGCGGAPAQQSPSHD